MNIETIKQEELFEVIQKLQEQVTLMNEAIEVMKQHNKMFNLHFSEMYEAKSIDEVLKIMSKLGEKTILAEQCNVYSLDERQSELFTINENGERQYLSLGDNALVKKAYEEKTVKINNSLTENSIIVPLIDKANTVIGVVVAKNKEGGFTKSDAEIFDLQKGNLGTAFCMAFENKALCRNVTIDELTGLGNLKHLNEVITTDVLSRIKNKLPVSYLQIDANWFKQVNDNLGHNEGDNALKIIANAIVSNTRKDDTATIRQGGDEFCVVLPVDEKYAFEIAERIRKSIENVGLTFLDKETGREKLLTVSIGVAQYKTDEYFINKNNIFNDFKEKAISLADKRLYQAKALKSDIGSVTICSRELNLNSTLSPTSIFKDYLNSLEIQLIKHEDGYELVDDLITLKRAKNTQELIDALAEFTDINILRNLEQFEQLYGMNNPTINDWAELVRYSDTNSQVCRKELEIVDAIVNHVEEINLDLIANKEQAQTYKKEQKNNKERW